MGVLSKCKFCSYETESKSELKNHLKRNHQNETSITLSNGKILKFIKDLNINKFPCICNGYYLSIYTLRKHINTCKAIKEQYFTFVNPNESDSRTNSNEELSNTSSSTKTTEVTNDINLDNIISQFNTVIIDDTEADSISTDVHIILPIIRGVW